MSRNALVLGVLAAAAVGLFTLGPAGVAQERKDEPATFDGGARFVSIVKKSNPASSTDLANPRIREIHGRAFVVGTGADVPDNWQKGRTVFVALDDISEVTTFATLEELRKANIPQDAKDGKKDGQ
jgi:hypothetical protein